MKLFSVLKVPDSNNKSIPDSEVHPKSKKNLGCKMIKWNERPSSLHLTRWFDLFLYILIGWYDNNSDI